MSAEALLLALAFPWLVVAVTPTAIDVIDHKRRALAEIRAAEELADRQFKKAIASLRRARVQ